MRNVTITGAYTDLGVADTHTVTIDWGDGSSSAAVLNTVAKTFTATRSYNLSSADQYFAISATVTDDDTGSASRLLSPQARNDEAFVNEDSAVFINVLANDVALPGLTLTPQLVTGAAQGQLVLQADNTWLYTPNANFNGDDSFSYRFSDGQSQSNLAHVAIKVRSVIDAPTLSALGNVVIDEGQTLVLQTAVGNPDNLSLTGWVFGGDAATATGTLDPATGQLTLQGVDGGNALGLVARVSASHVGFEQAFNVTVRNVAPTVTGLSLVTTELAGAREVILTGSYTDPGVLDWHTVAINWGDGSASPTAFELISIDAVNRTFSASHRFTLATPQQAFGITATVTDKDGANNSRSIQSGSGIVNASPTLAAIAPQSVAEGGIVTVQVQAADPDSTALTYSISGGGANASASISTTGLITLTGLDGAAAETITVRVSDGNTFAERLFNLTVTNVAPTLTVTGAATATTGVPYTLQFGASDPGRDTVSEWRVNWGDGSAVQVLAGTATQATRTFASPGGSFSIQVSAVDEDGTWNATPLALTASDAVNAPPTLAAITPQTVAEGAVVTVQAQAADPDSTALTYSISGGGGGANASASISTTGLITLTGLDGAAAETITVRVSDGNTFAERLFNLTVTNVAPTLTVTGAATGGNGVPYVLQFGAADPGRDTVSEWRINWGDGSPVQTLAGTATQATRSFGRVGGNFDIVVSAVDEDGTWTATPQRVAVATDWLNVTQFTPSASGFSVRFDHTFDASKINLFETGATVADVVLRGVTTGLVTGSLAMDADGRGFKFLRTGGLLAFDTYTVTLASGPTGFRDAVGLLDGNNDGTPGDNAAFTFDFRSTGAGVLSLPDFMRGPGQPVDVPATQQRLPVTFASAAAGNVRSMVFTVGFDPALLDITGAVAGAALPAGSTVSFFREAAAGGGQQARITITLPGSTALPAGALRLVDLVATVPTAAVYGRTQFIDLTVTQINGSAPLPGGVAEDDALHIVGYWGDTTGDARYGADDVSLLQRVIVRLDNGFSYWRNLDPVLIADIAGGGTLNSLDSGRLQQEVTFVNGTGTVDRPEIPPIPPRSTPINFLPASVNVGLVDTARILSAPFTADTGVGVATAANGVTPAAKAVPVIRLGLAPQAGPAASAPKQASLPWLSEYLTQSGQAARMAPPVALKVVLAKTVDTTLA